MVTVKGALHLYFRFTHVFAIPFIFYEYNYKTRPRTQHKQKKDVCEKTSFKDERLTRKIKKFASLWKILALFFLPARKKNM